MSRHITRRGLFLILAVLVGALVIDYVAWHTRSAQDRNIQLARSHAVTVTPRLRADPRFELVQCGGGTAEGGCFWVFGIVSSEQDFAALRHLVNSTHPPVHTLYQIRVEAPVHQT